MALNLLCAQEVPRRGEDALYPSPLCNKQGKSLLGGQSCPTAVHVGLHSLWGTEDSQRSPPGLESSALLGAMWCSCWRGGLGPSHYWGWACSMLGCTAQLHISPAATPLLAWDRCWVLPAGAVCSGCSHSILQSILLCANPTAWPCSCSGAAPGAPVSLYEHWGGGGNEPEGDAGSSCSWGSPSLVCLHRQCPMEHTGTGCGVPLVRSPTAPQHHAPIRPLALRSNIIFIGETGRG